MARISGRTLSVFGALLLTTGIASANREFQANVGRVQDQAYVNCVGVQWYSGGVVNNCGTTVTWVVPLPIEATAGATKTVNFSAYNPSGQSTQCRAIGWDDYITGFYASNWNGGGYGNFRTQVSVYVPYPGFLYGECRIAPGGILYSVNYYN